MTYSDDRDVMILNVAFSAARSEGAVDEDPVSSMASSLSSQDRHSAGQAGGACKLAILCQLHDDVDFPGAAARTDGLILGRPGIVSSAEQIQLRLTAFSPDSG